MGCYNGKSKSNILNLEQYSNGHHKRQTAPGSKYFDTEQFDKQGTKCENDQQNQDIDHFQEEQNEKIVNNCISVSKQLNKQIKNLNYDAEFPVAPSDPIPNQIAGKEKEKEAKEENIVLQQKGQFQTLLEQEGFNEKINHINKLYNLLLQSEDDRVDHYSIDDKDLNDFLSGLQGTSVISHAAAALDINQIRRDTRGETIIEIPNERKQNNFKGIANVVLSSDYRLITSPTSQTIQNNMQFFDKQNTQNEGQIKKQTITLRTDQIAIDILPDNVEYNKSLNSNQKFNCAQNIPISSPKVNFSGILQGQNLHNNISNNNSPHQISTPRKNIPILNQQSLFTICEEAKGGEGQEEPFENETEFVDANNIQNQQQIQQEDYQQDGQQKQNNLLRYNTDNPYIKKKPVMMKNGSSNDVYGNKTKSYSMTEKQQRYSMNELKQPQTPSSFYHVQSLQQNHQLSDHQAIVSLYRQSTNLNDYTLQEIEQDFKDNPCIPQCQVSSFAFHR